MRLRFAGLGQRLAYLNGLNVDECGTSAIDTTPTAASLRLGVDFDGVLDEVAIYGHALLEERVTAHYEEGMAAR